MRRVGAGGSALDPEVVSQMLGRRRYDDPIELVISERAVEKHVTEIFAKLNLSASSEDRRRVLAVLRFLDQPA